MLAHYVIQLNLQSLLTAIRNIKINQFIPPNNNIFPHIKTKRLNVFPILLVMTLTSRKCFKIVKIRSFSLLEAFLLSMHNVLCSMHTACGVTDFTSI